MTSLPVQRNIYKVTISDEDITYLQTALEQAVTILMTFAPNLEESNPAKET